MLFDARARRRFHQSANSYVLRVEICGWRPVPQPGGRPDLPGPRFVEGAAFAVNRETKSVGAETEKATAGGKEQRGDE